MTFFVRAAKSAYCPKRLQKPDLILTQDDKNPWGSNDAPQRPKSQKPQWNAAGEGNAVDDMIDQIMDRLRGKGKSSSKQKGGGTNGSGGGSGGRPGQGRALISGAVIALALFWGASSVFRVKEGEVGVVLRFGEMVRTVGPGLRFHIPAPIEKVFIQKVSAVNRIDGGIPANVKNIDSEDALTLTSDENMVIISYSMQWRIKDVSDYLFTAREPNNLITVAAESAVREVVGQTPARMALTEGRQDISTRSHELLQKILDAYKIGVEIVSFQLQRVEPPPPVIESFNDVQASLVDADRLKNEAEAYRNKIVPVARGQAEQINQDAMAYAKKHIAEAEGEAAHFDSVYKAYATNKDVVLGRAYLNTMKKILEKAPKIILDPKVGKDMVPYLPLNELSKAKGVGAQGTAPGAKAAAKHEHHTQDGSFARSASHQGDLS